MYREKFSFEMTSTLGNVLANKHCNLAFYADKFSDVTGGTSAVCGPRPSRMGRSKTQSHNPTPTVLCSPKMRNNSFADICFFGRSTEREQRENHATATLVWHLFCHCIYFARRVCYSWEFAGCFIVCLCLFCGWVLIFQISSAQLRLFDGFMCWYGWVFSNSSVKLELLEKSKKSLRQILPAVSHSIPQYPADLHSHRGSTTPKTCFIWCDFTQVWPLKIVLQSSLIEITPMLRLKNGKQIHVRGTPSSSQVILNTHIGNHVVGILWLAFNSKRFTARRDLVSPFPGKNSETEMSSGTLLVSGLVTESFGLISFLLGLFITFDEQIMRKVSSLNI